MIIVERIGISANGTRSYKVTFPDGNTHTLWSGYEPETEHEQEAIREFAFTLWCEDQANGSRSQNAVE